MRNQIIVFCAIAMLVFAACKDTETANTDETYVKNDSTVEYTTKTNNGVVTYSYTAGDDKIEITVDFSRSAEGADTPAYMVYLNGEMQYGTESIDNFYGMIYGARPYAYGDDILFFITRQTGGAHCCEEFTIIPYVNGKLIDPQYISSGGNLYLTDVNDDGFYDLSIGNKLDYFYASHADSADGARYYNYQDGFFVDNPDVFQGHYQEYMNNAEERLQSDDPSERYHAVIEFGYYAYLLGETKKAEATIQKYWNEDWFQSFIQENNYLDQSNEELKARFTTELQEYAGTTEIYM